MKQFIFIALRSAFAKAQLIYVCVKPRPLLMILLPIILVAVTIVNAIVTAKKRKTGEIARSPV